MVCWAAWTEGKIYCMFCEMWCSAEFIAPSKFNVGFFFFKASTQYQSWIYDKQIAGFYQQFGNITFLTVKVSFRHPCSLSCSFPRCSFTFLSYSFHKIHWCAAAVCERLHVLKHDIQLCSSRVQVTWFLSGLLVHLSRCYRVSCPISLTELPPDHALS